MPEATDLSAEIAALRAALVPPRATVEPAQDATSAGDAEPVGEVARLLGELRRHLAEAAPVAEEEIATHPLAAVAAAFLLGLALGRISRGI